MDKLKQVLEKHEISFYTEDQEFIAYEKDEEFIQDIIAYASEVAQNALNEASKKSSLRITRQDKSFRKSRSRLDTVQGLWGSYNETTTVDTESIVNSENIIIL